MALLNCSECGRPVSTKARFCPNCGAPPPEVVPLDPRHDFQDDGGTPNWKHSQKVYSQWQVKQPLPKKKVPFLDRPGNFLKVCLLLVLLPYSWPVIAVLVLSALWVWDKWCVPLMASLGL